MTEEERAAIIADISRMYEQLDDENKELFRIAVAVYAVHDKEEEEREQQAKDGERE
jgi:hypothetical protein